MIAERIVLDANVVASLLEPGPRVPGIIAEIGAYAPHAPGFLLVEGSNAIWKAARLAGLPAAQAVARQSRLLEFEIAYHPDASLLPAALKLAMRLPHSIYDCLYLALAIELDCAVLTLDKRLATAAASHADLAPRVRVLATS
ncbi:MAG: type II toxin-antitoxin system VapC family toxin [Tagaea sp.]|nr:type II toxin-antitoxin system VapC family toxin [Tagaea sp.]